MTSALWILICWSDTDAHELTMRFRTKTIVGVAVIEFALLAVLVGSALSILRESNEAELTRRVQLGGQLLAVAAKDAVISQDLATLDSLVAEAMASGQMAFVSVLDAGGTVLARQGDAALLARPFHPDAAIDQVTDGIFEWSAPVLAGGIRHGEVRVGVSIDPLKVLLANTRRWAASIAAIEIALVALFSWLLGSYLARQLVALQQASKRYGAGDFEHQIVVVGDDELAQTALALNRMAQQLGAERQLLESENFERVQAQQAAEKSSRLLRDSISSIAQGFTIYDEEDRLVQCNETYLRFYESSRDLIVPGNTFETIVRKGAERGQYAEAIGNVDAWVKQRVAQHQSASGEVIEQRLADGRWLLIVEHRTPSGYIVGNRIDITELKNTAQALADSEQRWELAVSGANDGIWDWNLQTDEIFFSGRWKSMLGYGDDEIGSTLDEWSSRVHPDDLEYTLAEVQRHLRGETAFYQCEHRMRCKNGSYIWILDRGRALIDAQGRAVRMSGSHSDITERRAAQEREREHAGQLKAIFTLSPDGFVSFDSARCVKYVSPAFTRMTTLQAHDMVGLSEADFTQRLANLCLPGAPFAGLAALRAIGADGNAGQRQVFELADANKSVIEVGLREAQTDNVSQVLYLRDITHETAVDRMKSEFLSTAAHELRTPMASIYGFAEVLLTQELDAPSQREFLAIIYKQSELMASILNELLDLARIEARKGKDFVFTATPLHTLVQEVVHAFKPPAGRSAPTLMNPGALFTVMADGKKAQQALLNVLSNAYKYSPGGGAVHIELLDAPATMAAAPLVGIRITDQGIGMTPAQLGRVFERFYRADSSGKFPGTGLGMSIVQEIMTLHRGKIDIQSSPGEGTTVTLWLPACQDSDNLSPPTAVNVHETQHR
ncbi:MAG: PAS-domain containing protein [Rhodoferax sp.]|nr:PAS-domain containing protein [Rhodoferax sp.]